jgi:myo-inositol-1(or 4)-monophosphatase
MTRKNFDWVDITTKVERICREVGAFQLLHWNQVKNTEIEIKSANQLVSFVDQQSEQKLIEGFTALIPESTFIGEELSPENRKLQEITWIIDPLDGTTNFLHGLPVFSISVALFYQDEPVVAVIHCPALQETFTASIGNGATLNGQKIQVANHTDLSNTLLATGFPYYKFDQLEGYLELLKECMQSTRGLRRMGSAAIDLAYVACGRFDAFFEMNLSPWDIAAGMLLVREAGGKVTDFHGTNNVLFSNQILATSHSIYGDFSHVVSKYLH